MKLNTIDEIIDKLYESVSFKKGEKPDYDLMRSLFYQGGVLTPPREAADQESEILLVEDFISLSNRFIETTDFGNKGFVEKEIARKTDRFGNIVHVLSAYEGRYHEDNSKRLGRGVNSIQLIHEKNRWWIISIIWDIEREYNPLPDWVLK